VKLVLGLFLISSLAAQEGLAIQDILVIPPEYYVGDLIEMRVQVETAYPEGLIPPSQYPTADWVEFRRIEILRSERRTWVVIHLVSFAQGERTLPVIQLGTASLRGLTVSTKSILGTDQRLKPYLDPLPLANTQTNIAVLLFLIFVLPVGLFYGLRGATKLFFTFHRLYQQHYPNRLFTQELQKLKKKVYKLGTRDFYEELNQIIRRWLLLLSNDKAVLSLTAEEIRNQIEVYVPVESQVWTDLLKRCERFVYSGHENVLESRTADLDRALASLKLLLQQAKQKKGVQHAEL
jgi:hypothetical protein